MATFKDTKVRIQEHQNWVQNQADKIKELTDLVPLVFKQYAVDLLKENNPLLKKLLRNFDGFGKGWTLFTFGQAKVEEYSKDPEKRFPQTRRLLQDFKQDITKSVHGYVRTTLNALETKQYFNGEMSASKAAAIIAGRGIQAFKTLYRELLELMFDGQGNFYQIENGDQYFNLATELKNQFTNEITYTTTANQNKTAQMISKIKSTIRSMILKPSDEWHLDPSLEGFPASATKSDLILIMSYKDKQKWEEFVSREQRNPEFFKYPEGIEIIELDIPEDTAYIIHKDTIQIANIFEGAFEEFYPATLDTDIYLHEKTLIGLSKLHHAVKIKPA